MKRNAIMLIIVKIAKTIEEMRSTFGVKNLNIGYDRYI